MLRSIKGLDESAAAGVREEARRQFEDHREETDLDKLRILLADGQYSLDQLRGALGAHSSVRRTPEARGR